MTDVTGKTIHERLVKIQQELNVPKSQKNTFGNYNYRSCEDILEAVKPFLDGLSLIISDEIVNIGERYYVQATALISDGKEKIVAVACAREAENKKGMDEAQVTGATSSYARKYALNGLFAIDDTKDADTMDNSRIVNKEVGQEEELNQEAEKMISSRVCSAHDEPVRMFQGKSKSKFDEEGNPKTYWWHKGPEGQMCFGQGYQ